ncbi:MAG: hypothetical protein ACXVRV_08030, partial [Gaiellaceae bacterium]
TQDPVRVMREVFAFLGVEPAVADQLVFQRRNAFRLPRGRVAKSIIDSQRLRVAARHVLPLRVRSRLEQALLAPRRKPPMEPKDRRQLEQLYAADGAALEGILNRPLPWSKRA